MIAANEALERLKQGNRRFASGMRRDDPRPSQSERAALANAQNPFAIILGCSDSRVPAEFVFDQGLGDLFVIRVAGNIVAPSQVGSVEFAASLYASRLVVVLGHSQCGAVQATLEELQEPTETISPNLQSIIDRVRPPVAEMLRTSPPGDQSTLLERAVRANVIASVDHLRHGSQILEHLIRDEGLLIVAAEYSLETGEVDFFEEAPAG